MRVICIVIFEKMYPFIYFIEFISHYFWATPCTKWKSEFSPNMINHSATIKFGTQHIHEIMA